MKVSIIDYGLGNTKSIQNACQKFTNNVVITKNPDLIKDSTHLIFPGVGSFDYGMSLFNRSNLKKLVIEHFKDQKPLLGICLGLQIFFNKSEEGFAKGLGLIEGSVIKIKKKIKSKERVPVINWRKVSLKKNKSLTYYFDHSYYVDPINKKLIFGYYNFDNKKIPSIIKYKNFIGCQFHPEKSGRNGLDIIKDFLK